MSIVNGDAGFVLTMIYSFSPARMLVREQYPSIHGQRYLVFGSTRVFVSIQSLVPGLAFSTRIRFGEADALAAGEPSAARAIEERARPGFPPPKRL